MSEANSNDRPFIFIILVIISINLIMTTVMFSSYLSGGYSTGSNSENQLTKAIPLPEGLATATEREKFFEEFRTIYNTDDNGELFSMFGKVYQLQMRRADFNNSMGTIRVMASAVNEGEYSHYKYEELGTGKTKYDIFYYFKSPEGMRELMISVTKQGDDPYAILSMNISITQ